jgi:hypothetical protein
MESHRLNIWSEIRIIFAFCSEFVQVFQPMLDQNQFEPKALNLSLPISLLKSMRRADSFVCGSNS